MANHKSAAKRARQTIRKTERNRRYISAVRTAVKKLNLAIEEGKDQVYCQTQKANKVPKPSIEVLVPRLGISINDQRRDKQRRNEQSKHTQMLEDVSLILHKSREPAGLLGNVEKGRDRDCKNVCECNTIGKIHNSRSDVVSTVQNLLAIHESLNQEN